MFEDIKETITRDEWKSLFKTKINDIEFNIPYYDDFRLGFGATIRSGNFPNEPLIAAHLERRKRGNIAIVSYTDLSFWEAECTFENYMKAIDILKLIAEGKFRTEHAMIIYRMDALFKKIGAQIGMHYEVKEGKSYIVYDVNDRHNEVDLDDFPPTTVLELIWRIYENSNR